MNSWLSADALPPHRVSRNDGSSAEGDEPVVCEQNAHVHFDVKQGDEMNFLSWTDVTFMKTLQDPTCTEETSEAAETEMCDGRSTETQSR